MRNVKFLCSPVNKDLYLDEIIDYADDNNMVSIGDLGLHIRIITVDCDNSYEAVKIASRKMFQENKGFNFVDIGVMW